MKSLSIFSTDAFKRIKSGEGNWEQMVPDFVDRIIKEKCLFGYCGLKPDEKDNSEDPALAAARAIEHTQRINNLVYKQVNPSPHT